MASRPQKSRRSPAAGRRPHSGTPTRAREIRAGSTNRPRVIVVAKRTPYSRYVEEQHDPHVLALLRRRDPSVARWKAAHEAHVKTLAEVEQVLEQLGARRWVVHGPRIVFDTADAALVVTVGGDGTLLAASHHVHGIPILGVNSSPDHSVGFFCAARRDNLREMLDSALRGTLHRLTLSRMQVQVNERVVARRVLNEALFCHDIPAAASRYILRCGRRAEEQLSSGFWVGTAAGSTGAMHSAGGKVLPLSSTDLQLVVREPFGRARRPYRMTKLLVGQGQSVSAISKMSDASMYLDGPFKRIDVRLGDVVSFRTSDELLDVLGLRARRPARR